MELRSRDMTCMNRMTIMLNSVYVQCVQSSAVASQNAVAARRALPLHSL